jgi:hypothetical protein
MGQTGLNSQFWFIGYGDSPFVVDEIDCLIRRDV